MFTSSDQIDGGVCGKPRQKDDDEESSSVEMASVGSIDERNVAMAVDDSISSVNQSQLPQTQPWDNSADDNLDEMMSKNEPKGKVWGELYPTVGTFPKLNLIEDTFAIGRSNHCDYIVMETDMCKKLFTAISKKQCEIFKNGDEVFIKDFSSNGTFVNGVKIGKGKCKLLVHDADISFANARFKVYVFRSMDAEKEKFPPELEEKYTVSKVLGSGQYGTVRLAFRNKDMHRCAIKIIKKSATTTNNISIQNEVKVLQKVRHPCIINLEDVIDSQDCLYIVLELAEGGELFNKIVEKRNMTESEAKLHFYQIAHAIKYLHSQNICHRDLKPENILLSTVDDNDPVVKVNDLGLSKLVNIGSELKTFCGTRNYLAPEVTREDGGNYTFKVDCWSLGVILYILLSGSPPFCDNRGDHMNLRDQILKANYTFYPQLFEHVSEDAKDLIRKLLQKVPENRLSAKEILDHPWLDDAVMKAKAHKLMETTQVTISEVNSPMREALKPIEIPVYSPSGNPSVTINKLKRLNVNSESEEAVSSKRRREDKPSEN